MRVSVIIPALNEERALPSTLEALAMQTGDFEIIIVDARSDDATRAVAESYRDRFTHFDVLDAPRGRASQMNAGAHVATGQWLLFVHADTRLPPGAIEAIATLTTRDEVESGCFVHRFSGRGLVLRLISSLHNYRFRRTLIMYGDQAMFVRRGLFRRIGGYPEALMEDVLFSEELRRLTRPIMLPLTVVTDSRKFEQIGELRALWWVVRILFAHRYGKPLRHREFFNEFR
jgi:rSAM/selenodomain-associated transferase 2